LKSGLSLTTARNDGLFAVDIRGHLESLGRSGGSTLIDSRMLVTDEIKIGARFIIAPLYTFREPI